MTTSTTTFSTSTALVNEWLGPIAGPIVYQYLKTNERRPGVLRWPDLDEEIQTVVTPRFHSPPPNTPGAWFDVDAVDYFLRFCRQFRHIKGRLAKSNKRLELDLWQIIFIAAPLMGWKDANGYRITRSLYDETAKKSGKSTLAAALANYLLVADGEPGAEIVCAAGEKEQARAVFEVAKAMVQGSPTISKEIRVLRDQLFDETSNSWFKVISSAGGTKAGLNLHGAIIDELLVQKGRELVDNLENATAARDQPIVAYFTTAGIDTPGSIYTEKRNYAEKVATGEIVDPTWLTAIWTLDDGDDWRDETVWFKSNPGLGKSVTLEYLRKRALQAIASPSSQNTFLRDHLNVRTGQTVRWLDINFWDRSGSKFFMPIESQLRGKIAYAGLDLASTTDLAALNICIPEMIRDPEDPTKWIQTFNWFLRCWTPAHTLSERQKKDQAPYEQWVNQGFLVASPGNVIDYDHIEQEVYRVADQFEFRRLHFDRWGSKQILQHVRDRLGHQTVYEMGQGFASMSPAMKETEKLILEGRIRHGNNPIIRYAVQSLAVKMDPAGNVKPDRDNSTGRIDPFVAGVMSIDAWSRDNLGRSAYEVDDETA